MRVRVSPSALGKRRCDMGVERTHYVIVGVRFKYDDVAERPDFEELQDEMEDNGYKVEITEKNGLTMVSDGMNGEYVVIGRVLAKAIDSDGLDFTICECCEASRQDIMHAVHSRLSPLTGCVQIYAFTHYH